MSPLDTYSYISDNVGVYNQLNLLCNVLLLLICFPGPEVIGLTRSQNIVSLPEEYLLGSNIASSQIKESVLLFFPSLAFLFRWRRFCKFPLALIYHGKLCEIASRGWFVSLTLQEDSCQPFPQSQFFIIVKFIVDSELFIDIGRFSWKKNINISTVHSLMLIPFVPPLLSTLNFLRLKMVMYMCI